MTVTTVAVVGLAHSCSAARRRGEGSLSHSSGPPTGPRRDSPLSAHQAAPPSSSGTTSSQSSKEDPFPTALQARPLPQNASILPRPPKSHAPSYHFLALSATVRLPRHGAGSPNPPRHRPTQRPLLTRFNPTTAPPPSGLTSTDTPRLRGLPRGTTGLVVRPTRVTAPSLP